MNEMILAAGEVSGGEALIFWILGTLAVAGAVGMLISRNAIHSALWLVLTMLCLGLLYFVQSAPFLGAVQIIVYTGAIMILFLFVLMLVGRDASDSLVETLRGQRSAAVLLGIGFAGLVGAVVYRSVEGAEVVGLAGPSGGESNVQDIAALIFTDYLLSFEVTSALLITAAVGAMVLAHIEQFPGTRRTQRAMAKARVRSGRPQVLPGPGVFATSDSLATPALLPDGSIAEESIPRGLERLPSGRTPEALRAADTSYTGDIGHGGSGR